MVLELLKPAACFDPTILCFAGDTLERLPIQLCLVVDRSRAMGRPVEPVDFRKVFSIYYNYFLAILGNKAYLFQNISPAHGI